MMEGYGFNLLILKSGEKMNQEEQMEIIFELNQKYKANDSNGIKSNASNFKIINGKLPILLSAPHAVKQNRNGMEKEEDGMTGAIVEYLCLKTEVNGIIRTYNLGDDPNFENEGYGLKYKNAMLNRIKEKQIKCVIDVHACKDGYGFDIDIGTNNGKNIKNGEQYVAVLEKEFSKIGKVTIDEKFKASREMVISRYIHQKSKIPCFQVEICINLRKNKLNELLEAFERIIEELIKEIRKGK